MLKLQAIFHDGSFVSNFMTEDAAEAEEMRLQMLDVEGVAEVRIAEATGWRTL